MHPRQLSISHKLVLLFPVVRIPVATSPHIPTHKVRRAAPVTRAPVLERRARPVTRLDLVAEADVLLVPLALLVDEGLLAVAAVPEGLVGRDLTDVEPGVGTQGGGVEDDVDFFEGAVAGFGEEEVDYWDGCEVAREMRVSIVRIWCETW